MGCNRYMHIVLRIDLELTPQKSKVIYLPDCGDLLGLFFFGGRGVDF